MAIQELVSKILVDVTSILEFIVILAVLIIIHEIGHFLASKLIGVEIEEFGIGIPPKVRTLFRWRETEFTLNAIPLGGFVRPKGENDPTIAGGLAAAPAWQRIFVYLAGPAMNLMVAVLLYSWLSFILGIPDPSRPGTVIVVNVGDNSPALASGLRVGNEIVSIEGTEIEDITQSSAITSAKEGIPLKFLILRDQNLIEMDITPQKIVTVNLMGDPIEYVGIGVSMSPPIIKTDILTSISVGAQRTYEHISMLLDFLGRLVTGRMEPSEGGLVGLPGMMRTYAAARDIENAQPTQPRSLTVLFVIELTVSLGLLNLLPVPALDGGRILLALPELLFRRRVPPQIENYINAVGFFLLLGLLIFVNVKDLLFPHLSP